MSQGVYRGLIYFDNAATGRVYPSALNAATEMINCFGNPSSPHKMGLAAAERLQSAREQVAGALRCDTKRIIFTSGGTEANNLALISHAVKNRRAGKKIVTNATEHPSVLSVLKNLETEGFQTVFIDVKNGVPDLNQLEKEASDACIVTFMRANNQTGCMFDPRQIREVLDRCGSKAMFHCDAVQAFCKTSDGNDGLLKYCDTVSVSAHKIGGIKGCGALYYGERAKILPLICGGDQENGLRGGTENTVGIAAFGAACRENTAHPEYLSHIKALRKQFIDGLTAALGDGVRFFIPPEHVDCIINFSIPGLKSEVCLNYLSSKGICVSSSSACSVRAKKNTVLPAYGLDEAYVNSAVRIGISHFNTTEEIDILISELKNAAAFAVRKR